MNPDPLTIASIELEATRKPLVSGRKRFVCGCEFWPSLKQWFVLCQYHQGYDDGVEAARRELANPRCNCGFGGQHDPNNPRCAKTKEDTDD